MKLIVFWCVVGVMMIVFCQVMFMNMDRGWGYFYQFVIIDELQSLFQSYVDRWNQNNGFVSTGSMYVGQFLTGQVVYSQVVRVAMNTDNLTFVNFCTVTEEQLTVILQTEQCECDCFTLTVRDQYAVLMLTYFTWMYVVVVAEGGVQQTSTGSYGYELRMEANQTMAWDYVVEMYVAFTVWIYVFQVAFMFAQCLYYRTLMLFFNVQSHVFIWLLFMTVDFMEDNFWMGYCQFETFMMYVFDQNRQVQFAMTRNVECIGVFGFFYVQCNVVYQFFVQMIQDLMRCYELTFFTVEW